MMQFDEAVQKLRDMNDRDNNIMRIFKVYRRRFPRYSKEAIVKEMSKESGLGKSTIWDLIKDDKKKKSKYESDGLTTL